MNKSVVIVGMGEMAGVFARGFLKAGYSVHPVTRNDDIHLIAHSIQQPALILVAVAEKDLPATLETFPETWKSQLVLLQNELLPNDWLTKGLNEPTIISVWFEKKPGQDYKVLVPSPVFGPNSALITEALTTLNIPTYQVSDDVELLFELVRKNMYILVTNICGLETGGTVGQLIDHHSDLMQKIFDEILLIQQHLTTAQFDTISLMESILVAFKGDLDHQCMGRSATQRLQRALTIAHNAKIQVVELERINQLIKK